MFGGNESEAFLKNCSTEDSAEEWVSWRRKCARRSETVFMLFSCKLDTSFPVCLMLSFTTYNTIGLVSRRKHPKEMLTTLNLTSSNSRLADSQLLSLTFGTLSRTIDLIAVRICSGSVITVWFFQLGER